MVRQGDGSLRALAGQKAVGRGKSLYDVAHPSVHWDGVRIVFSGLEHPDSNWRIFEINADGSNLRQLTHTDRQLDLSQFGRAAERLSRYDDLHPTYLPDGRIVFASTRFPAVAEVGDDLATNLFAVNPDGSELHRITTERNGADAPTIDPVTGRIVFSRWWLNLDRASNRTRDGVTRVPELMIVDDPANLWHAITILPDGDDVKLYAADARTRRGSQAYRPRILQDGRMLAIYSPTLALHPLPGGFGIRWFEKGPSIPRHVIGADVGAPGPPFAVDPVALPDGKLLISYSEDGVDYGLFLCEWDGSNLVRVVDLPGTLELNADLLAPRSVPPTILPQFPPPLSDLPPTEDPSSYFKNESFRFDCLNIFANADVDVPISNAPPITRNASIRFFLNYQRQHPHGLDPSILIHTGPITPRGAVHEDHLPADVPMFEQVVDSLGRILVGQHGQVAHVAGFNYARAGSGTKCVGCHAGHTMIPVAPTYSGAEWFNVAPSAKLHVSSTLHLGDTVWFLPEYAIDRKVKLSAPHEHWVASIADDQYIGLRWDVPVEVEAVILYGIPPSRIGDIDITITASTVELFHGADVVRSIRRGDVISDGGTRIPIAPPVILDRIRISISDFTGGVGGYHVPGLAEVEVIGRIAS